MPKIKVNDINLYYEIYGNGDPVIFVSGFTADHSIWQSMIATYAKNYQVIVFDNRGIGQSDSPNYLYTTELFADDIAELIKALKLKSPHLVGHSYGGCIVQTIAYKYPELTKSIVITNSFLKPNMRLKLYSEIRQAMMISSKVDETLIKFITMLCWSDNYLNKPGKIEELVSAGFFPINSDSYRNQSHALMNFNSEKWISSINCPALIICADEDLLANVEDAEQMASAIKNSEYFCFKKVGHIPQVEKLEEFNHLVLSFITKHN